MASENKAVHNPIEINPETCVKCDLCDWICPGDLIYKEADNRETLPVIKYPDECWYCGLCQSICPTDAITIVFPEQMVHNKTDVTSLLGKVVK
ncbi:MAG: ferredoxin family protein [Betaproteobacteria bacterium]|nr:ferredoxin family protein [Betaproteobacteria bacterium]